jgi:protein SCO1/2
VFYRGLTSLFLLLSGAPGAAPPTAAGAPSLADIGPAPPVALTDATGRPFALSGLRGKAVVVSFIYTTCNGSCPATTHALYRVQEALKAAGLWGKKVEFVSISLDPARDTPEVLDRYARIYDADPASWHFLTGPPERVAKVVADWGMWARIGPSGTLDHPSRIFLVDPEGRQREIYSLEFLKPATVVEDVKAVLAERRPEEARGKKP